MTYYVEQDSIWWDGKELAPVSSILVDVNQQSLKPYIEATKPDDIKLARLPVGDYVFVGATGAIVVVEEKRLRDLVESWKARRLQRQLRHVAMAGDVAILALRGFGSNMFELWEADDFLDEVWMDVLRWDLALGNVGFLPADDGAVLASLRQWRAICQDGPHFFRAVSGDDRHRKLKPLSPTANALMRSVDHVGREMAPRIAAHFGEDFLRALSASDEEWRKIKGVHAGILAARHTLLEVPNA